jgi:hypothetical protein
LCHRSKIIPKDEKKAKIVAIGLSDEIISELGL